MILIWLIIISIPCRLTPLPVILHYSGGTGSQVLGGGGPVEHHLWLCYSASYINLSATAQENT